MLCYATKSLACYTGYTDDSCERLEILLNPPLVMANSTSSPSADPVHGAKTSFMVLFIVSVMSSVGGRGGGGNGVFGASGSVFTGTGVGVDIGADADVD